VCHPPRRGAWWLGRSPLVHRGFMRSWAANGLGARVVAAIRHAVAESDAPASAMRILVTGAAPPGRRACRALRWLTYHHCTSSW